VRTVRDAEAVVALLQPGHGSRLLVRAHLEAARRLRHDVVVAAVTLAELYRGTTRSRAVDALLAREGDGLLVRDTDVRLARLVGALLHGAARGSEDLADAHPVALAAEADRAVLLTSDPNDLERLAAPYAAVTVVALT